MQIGHAFIFVPNESTDSLLEAVTYIQYDNFLKGATVLQGGDIATLYDGLTNIFMEVSTFPKVIEVDFGSSKEINCLSLAGCNFKSSAMTVSFEVYVSGAYAAKGYISNNNDNQPVMLCFESVVTNKVRITINASSTAYVGEIAVAKALKMPVSPSVGYRPARWNVDDEITHHVTGNVNIGRSTINKKGAVEVLPFKLINHNWMRTVWANFIKDAVGKAVWVGWNQLDYQNECIYGSWKQDESSYNSPLYSAINLTITGNI